MKGCARTLLLQLAGYLATAGAVAFLLRQRWGFPPGRTLGVSLGAGFLAWLALTLLFGIARLVREMSALRECVRGRRPADGKQAGIAGTIDAAGPILRAPLSGVDCVAFKYEIFQTLGAVRKQRKAMYFEGIGLTPSVIATNAGTFRLLAVPAFDFGGAGVETETALRNWAEHVATAQFEPESSRRTLERQWTDDDGAYRCERRHPREGEVPLEECAFREDVIRPGDEVYAVGLFSEARGGLVPHANWARETRIIKGDADSVLRQLKSGIVRYAIGAVLSSAAAVGVLWAFVAHAKG